MRTWFSAGSPAPGAERASSASPARPPRRPRWLRAAAVALAAAGASVTLLSGPARAADVGNGLSVNGTLSAPNSLVSPNGTYRLTMQSDGNLVEYGPGGAMWSSNTAGSGSNNYLKMQNDGNLVMYTSSGAVPFATGETGSGANDSLAVQNDGNVVQYGSGGAVFATNSDGERAIQWFYNHKGSTAYEEKCELAVENAFGTSNQYATAYSDWQHRAQHPNSAAAPRGTLVFYKTSADGHVAISLGNGTVFSSSASGHQIGISPITGWFSPLLGWAPSPW
jgi:hypothetical protein